MLSFFIFFLLFSTPSALVASQDQTILTTYPNYTITFQLNGGRFGDNILSFMSAAWFANIYNIPFLYTPFEYSEGLALSKLLEAYDPKKHQFDSIIEYEKDMKLDPQNPQKTLIISSFYNRPRVAQKNTRFREEMKKYIAPLQETPKVNIPQDCLSIAVHVRTGGTFAYDATVYHSNCLRFAPLSFFADHIKYVANLYPDRNIYVHLFTDDQEPEKIINFFKTILPTNRIIYGFRPAQENQHKNNVLEDFFAMMHFNVLIHPVSNFSRMASYLGNHELVIMPASYKRINEHTVYINSVRITKKENGRPVSTQTISYRR